MNYIHYTKEFIQKIEHDSKRELVYNKLDELKSIDRPESLNSINSYPRGILVLKFIKVNTCRIIIEPRWQDINGNKVHVLFIRDYISKKSFDYFWGNVVYPQLRSGEWILQNPLAEEEIQQFESNYKENIGNSSLQRPQLPERLVTWLNEFKITLNFDIYERESWVLYSNDRSVKDGLLEKYILLFKDTIKAIINKNTNDKVIINLINEAQSVYTAIFEPFNIGIIYSDFSSIEGKRIIVLHDGAHLKDQSDRWQKALNKIKEGKNAVEANILQISKDAFRAYPKWIVTNDGEELWNAIQRYEGYHNLSLLPEQVWFLNNFKFPAYINGQAGSGKSTMLYYLFANVYFYKSFDQVDGDIIFLTENDNLLEHTSKSIIGLLSSNPEFSIGLSIEERNNVRKHFSSFKNYLLGILPEEEKANFPEEKFLDFARFKESYNNSLIIKKYSAEEVWFVISTYVYGYYEDKLIDTLEKYLDEKEGIPSKFRIVEAEDFKAITATCLSFYRKLLDDGLWDKTKIVRTVRKFYPTFLPKQYAVVFCDEAQDFSRIELRLILQSSLFTTYDLSNIDQIPIVLAGDALQTVSPTGFSDTRLHQMYYDAFHEANFKYKKERSTYNPEYNYRSTQPIVRLANVIQNYRRETLHEEVTIKQESKRGLKGTIPILHSKEWILQKENFNVFVQKFKYKSFIIPIDLNEEEAYSKNDYLLKDNIFSDVKSSIDAKGAEYSQVVVYGFGEHYLKEFGNLIWKHSSNDFKKRFFFNKLYVAITRAQNELVLIDSLEAINSFWIPLLEIPDFVDRWESYSDINDLLPINPETGLTTIVESSPDDALNNATLDMEQGISDSNIGRLVVASNVFLMLGKIEEANHCLGHKEKIRQNWVIAGNHFLKAQKADEAADAFFLGGAWGLLNEKTKSLSGNKQEARLLIGKLMENGHWTREELSKVYELRNILSELLLYANWYDKYSKILIEFSNKISNSEEKRELAYVLESIVKDNDIDLWRLIGKLYYDTKQFNNAIEAWSKVIDSIQPLIYFPDYIRANLEKANDESNLIDQVLWTGRLLDSDIQSGERIRLSKVIIDKYLKNKLEILGSKVNTELTAHVYHASIILADFDLINELCPQFESKSISPSWVLTTYETFINLNVNEYLSGFLKERWAREKWKIIKTNELSNEEALEVLNLDFAAKKFPFDASNAEWILQEILEIPDVPSSVKITPPDHFKNITVKNFRRFDDLKISNIGQFNFIVGNNNSGKTSLLEALMFSPDPDICLLHLLYSIYQRNNNSEKERTKEYSIFSNVLNKKVKDEEIEYVIQNGRRSWTYILRPPSKRELNEINEIADGNPRLYLAIKEKRSEVAISKKLEYIQFDINDIDSLKKIPFVPFGKGYLDKLSAVYYSEIGSKKSLRDAFVDQMKIFIPNITGISINPLTDTIEIEEDKNGEEGLYALHDYGEGANKLFRILVHLHASKGKKLMIDEIDSGIHYSRFRDFLKIILEVADSYNVQIFVTTHNDEWIQHFISLLNEEQNSSYRDKARIITLEKHLVNENIVPIVRDFTSIEYAFDNKLELRGRKL